MKSPRLEQLLSARPTGKREVYIELIGDSWFVRYKQRRKHQRHSAAVFYAKDTAQSEVEAWVKKNSSLVLVENDMKLFCKQMWKKITIELRDLEQHDLHLCGWDLTDGLWEETKAPMFFAHYSTTSGRSWVEIKTELDWDATKIELFFRSTKFWAAQYIDKVSVTPFNESPAHAQAYLISRLLRGKGEPLTKDVIHWTLNMTGYSYPQEIRILSEQVAQMAGNMEKTGL